MNPLNLLKSLFPPDKPFYASLTTWGIAIFVGAQAACDAGLGLPPSFCKWVTIAGAALAAAGIRNAAGRAVVAANGNGS